jgi:general secretion pathway protein A
LLGQPELAAMLARPELRQLAQRIIARYHLGPLGKQEISAYVQHRLGVSGAQRQLFPLALMGQLYRLSGGIPRIINVLCDRALLGTYAQSKEKVDGATLKQAAREVFHNPVAQRSMTRPLLAGLLASTVLAAALYQIVGQTPAQTKAEAQAVTAKPVTALPDVLEWPASYPLSRSQQMAYTALFRAWGADYRGTDLGRENECAQAEAIGLRCLSARGGLDELRLLNLPAVLLMQDKQGNKFNATLTRLDDRSATFTVGDETKKVSLGAIAEQWSGHYTVLWRIPPVASKNLHPGDRGPDVEWLGKQLAQLNGKAPDTAKDRVFDEAMMRQVKQFQLAQGLIPDGAVGPQTMMRLSGAADKTVPKLNQGAK